MNKKQIIVAWIAGLIITYIFFDGSSGTPKSFIKDLQESIPITLIGFLLIHTLRTPSSDSKIEKRLMTGAAIFFIWASLLGFADSVLQEASAAESACESAETTCGECQ